MSRVKSHGTTAELRVRKLLHKLGYRYRVNEKLLPGRPDIVFSKKKKVIFVHGCFWHSHPDCKRARRPDTGHEYWYAKLDRNVRRDQFVIKQLTEVGWQTLVVWECQLLEANLQSQLIDFLGEPKS